MVAAGGAMAPVALVVGFLTTVVVVAAAAALVGGGEGDTTASIVALLQWAWAHTCGAPHPLLRRWRSLHRSWVLRHHQSHQCGHLLDQWCSMICHLRCLLYPQCTFLGLPHLQKLSGDLLSHLLWLVHLLTLTFKRHLSHSLSLSLMLKRNMPSC
uniref:Uncharacterized protein n=1 Tax=Arundo donax TaxID=35708 RepID=A0A0A9BRC9_ARUDO